MSQYLERQRVEARQAIGRAFQEIGEVFRDGADLRYWTGAHPVIMTTSAALAGFALAWLAVPTKVQAMGERIRAIREEMAVEEEPREVKEPESDKPGFLGNLVREALKAVVPALTGLITATMGQQAEPHDGVNGHSDPDSQKDVDEPAATG